MLLRIQQVASFMWQVDEKAVFSHGDEDKPDFFYMDVHTWYDMDKPKKITISVEPGDLLNGGDDNAPEQEGSQDEG